MKILITGGHVTPALAVIEELTGHSIVFVGRKYALESEQTLSFEYKEITKKKIKFYNLITGKFNRGQFLFNLKSAFKLPYGFFQAYQILFSEKPDVVLTFGSYLAIPVALAAFTLGIPLYLHEQTSVPGRAARIIGRLSKTVFVSFPDAAAFFPKEKTLLTGNPIRTNVLKIIKKPFVVQTDLPVLYITGGSLGSHSINLHIEKLLKKLLPKYTVIHQVGDTKQYDDFERLSQIKGKLPNSLRRRYILRKHFSEDEVGYVYLTSDIVVGRAGANTFFEVMALEKPAVFIPLPWSAEKEQQKQAEIFKGAGVGEVFSQMEQSNLLEKEIEKLITHLSQYRSNFKNLKRLYKENAARSIATEILKS